MDNITIGPEIQKKKTDEAIQRVERLLKTYDLLSSKFNMDYLRMEYYTKFVYKSESLFLQSPKTSSSIRKIAMGDILLNLLKNHKEWQNNNKIKYGEFYLDDNNIDYGTYINSKEYGFVCTGENGEFVNTAMFRHLSHVVNKQLNISFNFHSLRHTHATLLLESGANIKDIQVRLGHSKLSTTMDRYSHVTQKMSYESINLFENALK